MRAGSSDPLLNALLAAHPAVGEGVETADPGIVFGRVRARRVALSPVDGPFGLIEIMDNNPLVCADESRIPSPAQTLALIAVGPLLSSGLLIEPPALVIDHPTTEEEILEGLSSDAPYPSITLAVEESSHPTVRRLHAMCAVRNPRTLDEFDELFEERYGRTLYVRRDEESAWTADLVEDRPWAVYRLRISPGDDASLLTVSVMADLRGKLGACQAIHMMNVMDGGEESLGIPDRIEV